MIPDLATGAETEGQSKAGLKYRIHGTVQPTVVIDLHSMAVSHLAQRIGEFLPGREEGGSAAGGAAGLVGGIIGSALGGGRKD
jgi:hypothetical protein